MTPDAMTLLIDLDVERALLGCLLRDGTRLDRLSELVPAEAREWYGDHVFYDKAHRTIFMAMAGLRRDGLAVDPVSLQSRLRDTGDLEAAGGALYLAELTDVPPGESMEDYAAIILVKWRLRQQLAILDELRLHLANGDNAVDGLYQRLGELRAKAMGPDKSSLPRCLCAADFLAIERPKLVFLIEGLLPKGGKLTFSATSKFGKSMWAIQTGFALAAGDCNWLGWRFGPPVRVLYLQAEIMDGLLEGRLRWMQETMPPELDHERAARNLIIQEIATGRPNLITPEGRATVESLLAIHKPDVVILDPLAALHPGLEENDASTMGVALDYIGGLTLRFGCAAILIHHHGKGGAARGSSVFEAWPESDLQASFLNEDNRSVAQVTMRLRCAYNPGPIYLRMPAPGSPWFERMPEGWKPERAGRKPSHSPEIVAVVLQAGGPMRWAVLKAAVIKAIGCSERGVERFSEIMSRCGRSCGFGQCAGSASTRPDPTAR